MIKLIFDDVNKLAKFKSCKLYISEFTVFVKVSIDNLNEPSNPILSKIRKLERINKLKKNEIKIKNEILILSSVIFLSEWNIVLLITVFGLINFKISAEVIFKRI